jgi:periplasmic protein CpxP/Spy
MATNNKTWGLLVAALLVANTVTLVLLWTGKKEPSHAARPPLLGEYLTQQLGLDSAQQRQYQQLIQAHRSATAPLRQRMGDLKDSLFLLLKQGNPSEADKEAATAQIAAIAQRLERLHLDHFQQVRALCTPAQQQRFDGLLQEIVRKLSMPPHGPGGPGGPRPGERMGPPPGPPPQTN